MIRKGFFGAAAPSQQVPCDLRPSRPSVRPSVLLPAPPARRAPPEPSVAPRRIATAGAAPEPSPGHSTSGHEQSWDPLCKAGGGAGKGTKGILGRKAQISRLSLPPRLHLRRSY